MILPGIVSLEDNQIIKNIILLISVMHPLIRRMKKGEILAKVVAV
jgi:ribosomal protein L1